MSFVPPLFKNFGKGFKDLFEKKFDYDRDIKIKTTTQNGVTFETTGRASKSQDYSGIVKTTYKRADFGTFECELDTSGKAKYSAENDQLYKGLVVKVSGDQAPTGTVDVAYRREYLAVNDILTVGPKDTTLEGTVAVGFDGLSAGGQVVYSTVKQAVTNYNVGAEYGTKDYTVTVKTTDSAGKAHFSYLHNVSADATVGAQFSYNLGTGESTQAAVGSYTFDRDTTGKAKFTSAGVLSLALEQRLQNPKVKYGIAADFDAKNAKTVPDKFGLVLTLGDH